MGVSRLYKWGDTGPIPISSATTETNNGSDGRPQSVSYYIQAVTTGETFQEGDEWWGKVWLIDPKTGDKVEAEVNLGGPKMLPPDSANVSKFEEVEYFFSGSSSGPRSIENNRRMFSQANKQVALSVNGLIVPINPDWPGGDGVEALRKMRSEKAEDWIRLGEWLINPSADVSLRQIIQNIGPALYVQSYWISTK